MFKTHVLGIDLSKEWLDACLLPDKNILRISTKPRALKKWIQSLPDGIELAVMEATGGLERDVARLLQERGIPVAIVNPKKIRDFARGIGQLAKTDALDAYAIALYAQRACPEIRSLADEFQENLQELTARRRQILETITAEKNRLGTVRSSVVRKNITKHVRWLETQLKDIEQQINLMIQSQPDYKEREERLRSVCGVGKVVARSLLAFLPELGQLNPKQIAALCGLAPYDHQSGKHRGKSFIQGGRGPIRAVLYMAALVASRHNPVIRTFYRRLLEKGKCGKVALTACMRKLLVILNAMIRDKTNWNFSSQTT